jgi:hypothetical protein
MHFVAQRNIKGDRKVKIELLTSNRHEEYTRFILKDDRACLNSSLTFMRLLERVTKSEPNYLIALENDKIIGSLPAFLKRNPKYGNVLNSSPWYGSNPGITVDQAFPQIQQLKINLLGAFSEMAKENKAITSTIITRPFEKDQVVYRLNTGYSFIDSRIGMMTVLPEFTANIDSDLITLIHSKTRNLIRKAQKSDISFCHDSSIESLHFLANLHHENMLAIGVPSKDINFFDTLSDVFEYDKDYRVYLAEKDGKLIAALLVTYFNKTVSYFTPAVNVEYREYQPLNLLIFNAMKDSTQMGYHYWNWGGTAHSADGVYHFKKRWGSEECLYYYYTRSYEDLSEIISLDSETLLNEYPFFYVIPFSELLHPKE